MNIPQLSSAMSLANVQSNFWVAMLGQKQRRIHGKHDESVP